MRGSWLSRFSALTVLAGYVSILAGCASWNQPESEVYRRLSGDSLKPWKSVQDASENHWPYAWSAVSAYQDSDDPKRKPLETRPNCPEPHVFLTERGWRQWTTLPPLKARPGEKYSALAQEMRKVHLRAEVWSDAVTKQVVVAFGGTAASSMDDWKANFRWVLSLFDPKDQYTVLTDSFIPAFAAEYLWQAGQPGWEWLKDAQIVSTGHSLGGGLAQRFAYSLQATSGIPTVKAVFAFDPSPVSGKRSSPDFEDQAKGLTIYRIYNRGEILASLRSLVHFGNPGDRRNQGQTWVDIRYRDNWTWRTLLPSGSVHAHGMYDLACFMADNLPKAGAAAGLAPAAN